MYLYIYTIHDLIHGYTWVMLKMHIRCILPAAPGKATFQDVNWCIFQASLCRRAFDKIAFAMLSIQTFPGSRGNATIFEEMAGCSFWMMIFTTTNAETRKPTGLKDGGQGLPGTLVVLDDSQIF